LYSATSPIYNLNSGNDPVAMLDELMVKYMMPIPFVVYGRAKELATKIQGVVTGRRTQTLL